MSRGVEPLVSMLLLIVAAVAIAVILTAWLLTFTNNVITQLNETMTGIGYVIVEDVKVSRTGTGGTTLIFEIYLTPIVKPVKIIKAVVTFEDQVVCSKNLNTVIDEPFDLLRFVCENAFRQTGTYVIHLYSPVTKITTIVNINT